MSNNCLLTKLKTTISNDNLEKLVVLTEPTPTYCETMFGELDDKWSYCVQAFIDAIGGWDGEILSKMYFCNCHALGGNPNIENVDYNSAYMNLSTRTIQLAGNINDMSQDVLHFGKGMECLKDNGNNYVLSGDNEYINCNCTVFVLADFNGYDPIYMNGSGNYLYMNNNNPYVILYVDDTSTSYTTTSVYIGNKSCDHLMLLSSDGTQGSVVAMIDDTIYSDIFADITTSSTYTQQINHLNPYVGEGVYYEMSGIAHDLTKEDAIILGKALNLFHKKLKFFNASNS